MTEFRDELAKSLDSAPWSLLKLHAQRGGLIWVSPHLSLLEVGLAMAKDEVKQVGEWLEKGLLRKPTELDIQGWDLTPQREFMSLVVQPWALFQELSQ